MRVCRHMECRQCPAPVSQLLQLSPGRNSAVSSSCSLLGAAPLCDPPGEEVLREELILLNLFCPQTMVRPLCCRQEGTSSPSPSSSPSKLAFWGGEDILKMRVFLSKTLLKLFVARAQDSGHLLRGEAWQCALLGEGQAAQTLVNSEESKEGVHCD